jgi:Fibronectin type III domain/Kelch motif/Galactose oxidase, central domain
MKTNHSGIPLTCLIGALILTACGGGGGSSSSTPTGGSTYSLSGQALKGPFAIGSQISVNEQNASLSPTGKVYNVQTIDYLGDFTVSSGVSTNLVEIVGNGFYMNELTGQLSSVAISLRAIADLTVTTTPTVNALTTLQEQRLKTLMSQGMSYAAAYAQSQTEVLAAFGINSASVNSLSTLYSMQFNGNTDADSVLLATSVILAQMATDAATANGTSQPAELSNLINTMASQISTNGTVTSSTFVAARNLAETEINLSAVRTNVETYYANNGVTMVAPKFEEWIDRSGFGILPQRLVPVTGLTFTGASAAQPGQLITSNVITIAGMGSGVSTQVTVSAGTTIIKNNSAITGTISTVIDGDTLALRITSLNYGLTNTSTIIVGTSSTTWQVQTAPPAPNSVIAISGTGQVTVSWSPVLAATTYNIYWGTTAGITTSSTEVIGAASPYVQSGLTAGITYYYRVSAVSGAGETLSNEVSSFIYIGGNPSGIFTATGSMTTARYEPTATLLPSGQVLVAGGINASSAFLASAEIYDPSTGIFTATGSMTTARDGNTATLLPNGKVLVTGGTNGVTPIASAEIYDPSTGIFSATGSMTTARYGHAATLLPNGKVLVTGGLFGSALASAEIYDPSTGIFTATGNMTTPRYDNNFNATLLPNGKVLVAGGLNAFNVTLASAELYDPSTGIFTATGSMTTARYGNTVTILPNGKVLFAGGANNSNVTLASAEIYDPSTGIFTATGSMTTARYLSLVTLLPNGKVLVSGGQSVAGSNSSTLASAEIFDSTTGNFTSTGSMTTARYAHVSILLSNGQVLVAGGDNNGSIISSAELFQ